MIKRVGRVNVCVENEHTCRAKTLRGDAVAPRCTERAANDEKRADDPSAHDAHGGRDEIVLESVLHEKDDAEKQGEAADPGEEFHAENRFPIYWSGRSRSS